MLDASPVKRQRRKPGKVVRIDLGENKAALGLVLNEPLIAFFDRQLPFDEANSVSVAGLPIAFTLMVMNRAVTSGRWVVVGSADIPDALKVPPKFCKQDLISGEAAIYQVIPELAPHYERPASPAECAGLEAAAVWSAEHVEDRLRDHFAGVPNKWVQQLKYRG
jgi:hypothetical protein